MMSLLRDFYKKIPQDMTVKEACKKFLEKRKGKLSPTTIQGYECIIENSFPHLMTIRLSKLTNTKLRDAVDDECSRKSPATGKKFAPKTIKNSYRFIAEALNRYAPDLDTRVDLPETKRKPVTIIHPQQVYEAVKGTPIELPCLLSMWLTLSMSEIRGLTKSKSIKNGQLTVWETVIDIGGKPIRKEGGKEEELGRTLDIPPYIQELIDQVDDDVIVPLSATQITHRFYNRLKKFGLPHIKFHALRHISASVMGELRVPEKDAIERGGWKTDHIYKSVYTHSFTESRIESDKKINTYFETIVNPKNK